MAKAKNIKGGSLNTLAEQTIDNNTMYAVTNYPQGGITNAQMADALDQIGWYKDGDVFLCTDSGTYEQNKFYKYTITNDTASWVECQVGGGMPVLTGTTDPTISTVGQLGQMYITTDHVRVYNKRIYVCLGQNSSNYYIWVQVGGGTEEGFSASSDINRGYSAGGATWLTEGSVAIGYEARTWQGSFGTAIGNSSQTYNASYGIAIGAGATSQQEKAIQLGQGTNTTSNTFQVFNDNIYNHSTHTLSVQNLTDGTTTKTMSQVLNNYLHNISISSTTAAGTWNYQFTIKNNVATAYTQLTQIGHFLFENYPNVVLPASGLCVYNLSAYFITDISADTDNVVNVGMYKVGDGTRNVISSGVIDVSDTVM